MPDPRKLRLKASAGRNPLGDDLLNVLRRFSMNGIPTREAEEGGLRYFTNAFWTARQRDGHSLHEISYRACFKPQLPAFFIARLTVPGDCVYDPFSGRGTTAVEAALSGRRPMANDVNPLSAMLVAPRLDPPSLDEVARRLTEIRVGEARGPEKPIRAATKASTPRAAVKRTASIGTDPRRPSFRHEPNRNRAGEWPCGFVDTSEGHEPDLSVFYHPDTLRQIRSLRTWLIERDRAGRLDRVDAWLRMVAINRLTGHSPGFFSVYTMPPNQAVSVESQRRINAARCQTPPVRDIAAIILKKSVALLADGAPPAHPPALLTTGPADAETDHADGLVKLIVTSPPFLDVVDYRGDNWLRCWFAGIDPATVRIDQHRSLAGWEAFVRRSFARFARLMQPDGIVAFEVGEVRGGSVLLEHHVAAAVEGLPFDVLAVMVNEQSFTKTANCWGIENNRRGTNTNRIVLLRRRA